MLLRLYCENGHGRSKMEPQYWRQTAVCILCGEVVTRESFRNSIPPTYQRLLDTNFGGVLASFADIGAIDVIYRGKYPLDIEYPREKDINDS